MHISKCEGKYSITKFKVLKKIRSKLALVALQPITGRTHQLRLHMHHMGCPILGDKKYFLKESPLEFNDFTNDFKFILSKLHKANTKDMFSSLISRVR